MRAALALIGLLAGCGGGPRPVAPRSSCVDAAASIVRGLRTAAPAQAGGAPELEPRFVQACRSSSWRPAVVRCFALARDPAEQRVCARRLDPAQRDEARLIQGTLYPASRRPGRADTGLGDSCRRLGPVLEVLLACDRLSPFDQLAVRQAIEAVMRGAAEVATTHDPLRTAQVSADCERLADMVRAALVQAGC